MNNISSIEIRRSEEGRTIDSVSNIHPGKIQLDSFKRLCVRGWFRVTHKVLKMRDNGAIMVSSVCCVEKMNNSKFNLNVEIGSRIKKTYQSQHILGICRWIGFVNDTVAIAVEIVQCSDGDMDRYSDTELYLDNSLTKIVLFQYDEFLRDPESEKLKAGDIVKYKIELSECFGRVLNIKKVRDVSYVDVINCIDPNGDEQTRTLRKEKVIKIRIDDSMTKYLDNTLIDPTSVVSVRPRSDSQFTVKDEVEFSVESRGYRGKITLVAEINDLPCAIVELTTSPWDIKITEYLINGDNYTRILKDTPSLEIKHFVIVVSKALTKIHKKILLCLNNNVSILNPARVKIVTEARKEDKIIIFKNFGKRIIARLKWRGNIDGDECIGCEMKYKSIHGTSGVFGTSALFKCKEGHGALILLDTILDCCVKPNGWFHSLKSMMVSPHVTLGKIRNNIICGSTICCVEPLKEFRYQPKLKIGCRVMDMGNKIFGYCRWMGVVNGKEVIGVEMVHCVQGHSDKDIDELALFDNSDNKIMLFTLGDFKLDDIGLYFCTKNKLVAVDHDIIKRVNDGKTLNKIIIYKAKDNTVSMDIKWKGIVNGEECVGYEMTHECVCGTNGKFGGNKLFDCVNGKGALIPVDKLMTTSEIGIESDEEKRSMVIETLYFESIVLDPRSLITAQAVITDKLVSDTNVKFRLNESYRKYYGSVKWTGLVNNVMCAVIHVENISSTDTIRRYICTKSVIDKLKLSQSDNLYIVLLAALRKMRDKLGYLRRMLSYVNDKEIGVDILMDLIIKEDVKTLRNVIKEWRCPINLERYPELLPKLLKQDNYQVISVLLDNIVASDIDNEPLLIIAKHFITTGDHRRFVEASKKCTNVNIVLDNGETFVTDVMKTCDDEAVINRVIGSNIFDINKVNKYGDSPLVVACKQCMVTTVRLLLSAGASVSYNNNMALGAIMDLRNNITDMVKVNQILEIINLLTTDIRLGQNECKICMERTVNMVFNCGHTVCDVCSNEIDRCPDCQRDITFRNKLFLP